MQRLQAHRVLHAHSMPQAQESRGLHCVPAVHHGHHEAPHRCHQGLQPQPCCQDHVHQGVLQVLQGRPRGIGRGEHRGVSSAPQGRDRLLPAVQGQPRPVLHGHAGRHPPGEGPVGRLRCGGGDPLHGHRAWRGAGDQLPAGEAHDDLQLRLPGRPPPHHWHGHRRLAHGFRRVQCLQARRLGVLQWHRAWPGARAQVPAGQHGPHQPPLQDDAAQAGGDGGRGHPP
mmetsp:Transcript_21673/g.60254  ORF Transcript_21673/g.60254 Transcript_21673/m.60254 type:complete len:227 (+) Transcript_21673:1591-2271(+)